MRFVLLLALVSLTAHADPRGRFERFCGRTDQGRTHRGLQCDSGAFFEAFGTNGAGTTTACSTTAPTGARGEALTFTRGSNGTCTKTATGGLATSGIADGDLVSLSSNVARVEYDSAGVLGLLVESSRTNVLLQYIALANAVYADVATPTLTGSQTDPKGGTNAVQIDDNDAAAFEGRSQTVTVSAGVAYTAHCYVKAGTLAKATISLDGTTASVTDLSATTWSIVEVTDASSSGVAIAFQVLNGSVASDTGTVKWGGCQVEAGTYRTSIIETAGAAVARSAETAYFNTALPASDTGSMAATLTATWTVSTSATSPLLIASSVVASPANNLIFLNSAATSGTDWRCVSANAAGAAFNTGVAARGTGPWRAYCAMTSGGTIAGAWGANAMAASAAQSGTFNAGAFLNLGQVGGANHSDGIVSRVCRNPSDTRCR